MSTPVHILDGRGTKQRVSVSDIGQLIVAPFAHDETKFVELAEDDIAYNFYGPKAGFEFVITGMRIKANRQVSNTVDATIIIYEASAAGTTVVDKILHEEAMIRGESATLLPMNILVNEGKYINAKTSDDDVFMTIMGYRIPRLS